MTTEPMIDGAAVLDDVHDYVGRFVAYPSSHAQAAHALWIAHTHMMEVWDSTPRLAFISPEPGSGKSRALEVTEALVPNPVEAVNATSAYLFRRIGRDDSRPTVLYDELDALFSAKTAESEEIRALLNSGHRRHGMACRCVVRGKEVHTEEISAYAAVAVASLHGLPDTLASRSVIIRMRRRAPGETVEPYRRRINWPEAEALRNRLAAWATQTSARIEGVWPEMPPGIADRDADVWESLIAIADAAGGIWPAVARVTAVTLTNEAKETTPTLGVKLLADLRTVFGNAEVMATEAILKCLVDLDESPWGDLRGRALDARGLSRRLRAYGVHPATVRLGEITAKGYRRSDLHDPWQRYVPDAADTAAESVTSVTSVTAEAADAQETPL